MTTVDAGGGGSPRRARCLAIRPSCRANAALERKRTDSPHDTASVSRRVGRALRTSSNRRYVGAGWSGFPGIFGRSTRCRRVRAVVAPTAAGVDRYGAIRAGTYAGRGCASVTGG